MDRQEPPNLTFYHRGRILAVLELGAQATTSQLVDYPTSNN